MLTGVTDCTDEAGKKTGRCFSLAKRAEPIRILAEKCIHVRSDFFHFMVDHIIDAAVGFEICYCGV